MAGGEEGSKFDYVVSVMFENRSFDNLTRAGCGGRRPTSSRPEPQGSVFDVVAAGGDRAGPGPRCLRSGRSPASSAGRCRRCRGRWRGTAARTATALPGPIGWRCCGHPGHDPASWPRTQYCAACGRQAAVALVAAANQPTVDHRSSSRADAGVPRDDLHLAVCADQSRACIRS